MVRGWPVILARELSSASGRSAFPINGRMCTAATVRQVAADLIDIHGQHDHQSLLSPGPARGVPGRLGRRRLASHRRRAQELFGELRAPPGAGRAPHRRAGAGAAAGPLPLPGGRIDAREAHPGEEEELLADRTRLRTRRSSSAAGTAAKEALDGDEVSAVDLLGHGGTRAGRASAVSTSRPARSAELLETAVTAAQEAASELRSYLEPSSSIRSAWSRYRSGWTCYGHSSEGTARPRRRSWRIRAADRRGAGRPHPQ